MNNLEPQKKNIPYVIILLIIIIIGMGGYIVYDKFITSNNDEKASDDDQKNKDTQSNNNEVKTQRLSTSFGYIEIFPNGNVYLLSQDEISGETANVLGSKQNIYLNNDDPIQQPSNCIEDDFALNCEDMNGYKLNISNISSVYDLNYGQAVIENNLIALISDSGDLYLLTYYGPDTLNESKLKINGFEKSSLSNIVSVTNNSATLASTPIAIDKNGDRHYIDVR